jgi:DNA repair protein RadA/Sms
VSTVTSTLLSLSKSLNISIILVGHVTKDGQIAGPKTLEHLVDSVLFLDRSENPMYRTLSFSKHRFGSTENLLLLKMEEDGLSMVKDASLALLENIDSYGEKPAISSRSTSARKPK